MSAQAPVKRYRCGDCGRSRPAPETVLIPGNAAGDYRRPGRMAQRRVCRDCTAARVGWARGVQAKGLNFSLNSNAFQWEVAARHFGLDISGLKLDQLGDRAG